MSRKRNQTAMQARQSLAQLTGASGARVASHSGPGSCRNGWILPALLSHLVRVAQEILALR